MNNCNARIVLHQKSVQLIEHNMKTIFLENHTQSLVEKLFPYPNQRLPDLWTNAFKFYIICFYCMSNCGLSKYIKTKLQTTCFYFIRSFDQKQKKVWNQFPFLIFCMISEEKYFFCYIPYTDQISLSGYFYFVKYWAVCALLLSDDQILTS